MSVRPASGVLCHVLREDPEMAEVIPPSRREQAIDECTAREMWIRPDMSERTFGLSDGIGLLVLEGLLIRRVGIEGRFGAELLGEGDVLRPWQTPRESPMLRLTTDWSIVAATRVAVLDSGFVEHLGRYPELAGSLVARAIARSRNLAVNMAIVHQARVDVRLHMLLWHLAGRWGRVRTDGTVVPLRLTHSVLADLVAARRPTVTSALSDLARRELVRSSGDVWILSGEPPGELLDLETIAHGDPKDRVGHADGD